MIYIAFFAAKKCFFCRFILLKLVCVHSQNFSLLVCPEDTFSDGRPAKRDNKANLSPARFSWSLG